MVGAEEKLTIQIRYINGIEVDHLEIRARDKVMTINKSQYTSSRYLNVNKSREDQILEELTT